MGIFIPEEERTPEVVNVPTNEPEEQMETSTTTESDAEVEENTPEEA